MTELVTYVKKNGTKIRVNPNQPLIEEKIAAEGWKNWDEMERERLKEELKAEIEAEELKRAEIRKEIESELKEPRKRRTKAEIEADEAAAKIGTEEA